MQPPYAEEHRCACRSHPPPSSLSPAETTEQTLFSRGFSQHFVPSYDSRVCLGESFNHRIDRPVSQQLNVFRRDKHSAPPPAVAFSRSFSAACVRSTLSLPPASANQQTNQSFPGHFVDNSDNCLFCCLCPEPVLAKARVTIYCSRLPHIRSFKKNGQHLTFKNGQHSFVQKTVNI
jgi:hypothetical protein